MKLDCDFCGGDTDQSLKCKESDCAADMRTHCEMTLPFDSPLREHLELANVD